ncbi:MAG: hypothetical protein M1820_005136 [Bogoriella megaspora]|nr:MAG: hypothetical protein M1820_005136 [Bogoriella megaspora]
MAGKIRNVIVIGGSGNTGPYILEGLRNAGLEVAVLSRASSTTKSPENLKVYKTDYTKDSLVEIFKGYDAIVSVIETESTDQQNTIIDAAVEAGVKRYLPSEFGIDTSSPEVRDYVIWGNPKQNTVEYLKTKENTSLSWTALCVGAYFDWALEYGGGMMGWDIAARKATIFDSGDQSYEATNVRQIGRAVASVLLHLEETKNRYVYVNSFTLTQNQVLKELERSTGEKFEVTSMTTKEISRIGYENLNKGDVKKGMPQIIFSAVYGYGGLNNFSVNKGLDNEMLGLPQESLEETIAEVVKQH